jgi:hypothetical protein
MAKYTLRIDQGATFKRTIYWRDSLRDLLTDELILDADGEVQPGSPINLFGFTGRMDIRKSVKDTVEMLDLTTANGGIVIPMRTQNHTIKGWCRLATTADHALSGLASIDGVTPVAGDRILVKAQTLSQNNGIYTAASGAWARTSDADAAAELTQWTCVYVHEGLTNKKKTFRQTDVVANLATDPQTWVVDANIGRIDIVITDEQTSTLTSSGVYDLEMESAGGEVDRILEGKMRLSAEVTRPVTT